MKFQLVVILCCVFASGVLSLNCYTCLNQPLNECMKSNQTCHHSMKKCFSMQKKALSGSLRYTKYCADEWYCERYDAACDDLDEPEYSYLDCNVGCCTSSLCNHAEGTIFGRTFNLFLYGFFILVAVFQYR